MARDEDEIGMVEKDAESAEDVGDEGERSAGPGIGFVVGFVLGALVGAGTALLLAPARGEVTRRRIGRRLRRLREGATDRLGEIRDGAERELKRAKRGVRRHLPD